MLLASAVISAHTVTQTIAPPADLPVLRTIEALFPAEPRLVQYRVNGNCGASLLECVAA